MENRNELMFKSKKVTPKLDSFTEPLCELFEIIEDPVPVLKYLEGRNRNGAATISDIIKILSIDEICSLWDILKVSKYTKDPTSIVKRLDTALKAHILQKY